MTIQAYVDETGMDGKSPFFLFAALLGTLDDWTAFSDRWKSALEESPRIPYFKMDEAVGFQKQFYGWSESKRNQKLIRPTFQKIKDVFQPTTVSAKPPYRQRIIRCYDARAIDLIATLIVALLVNYLYRPEYSGF